MTRVSSCDLRAAFDRLIYEKSEYCRRFKVMTPKRVQAVESTLAVVQDAMLAAARKIKDINDNA